MAAADEGTDMERSLIEPPAEAVVQQVAIDAGEGATVEAKIGLPKKVRALALKHALSAKAKDGGIVVLDKATVKEAKTKQLAANFEKLGWQTGALIIDGAEIEAGFRNAARNIPNIDVLPIQGINVYDIMRRGKLVLTKAAVDALEARFK